jgi:hypothetical protein
MRLFALICQMLLASVTLYACHVIAIGVSAVIMATILLLARNPVGAQIVMWYAWEHREAILRLCLLATGFELLVILCIALVRVGAV